MSDREQKCAYRIELEWVKVKSDLERFMNRDSDDDEMHEQYMSYALGFDYVAPGTFDDQEEGYWRYQMSWGGPSDEIRFFGDSHGHCYRAEYWFMDWFDGAKLDVTGKECVNWLWEDMVGLGAVRSTYDEAMEDA